MLTFIIVVGVILVALFLIVVVYPIVAKKLSPDLKRVKGRFDHKGASLDAEWSDGLNRIAEVTESESPLLSKNAIKLPPVRVPLEEYVKELEDKIERINKQLLGTATVATSTAANILDPDRIEYFKRIAKASYADVKQTDPHSDLINLTGPFLKICTNCKWGTKMSMYDVQIDEEDPFYAGLGYVKCENNQQKHPFNDSCDNWEPRPEESQQSKP